MSNKDNRYRLQNADDKFTFYDTNKEVVVTGNSREEIRDKIIEHNSWYCDYYKGSFSDQLEFDDFIESNMIEQNIPKNGQVIIDSLNFDIDNFEKEKNYVQNGMIDSGGSFVKHLGQALVRADISNACKIATAFPEYWKTYLEVGKGILNKKKRKIK